VHGDPASGSAPSVAPPTSAAVVRPETLVIGRRAPAAEVSPSPVRAPGVDLDRLAELRSLVQALYRALTEPREGGAQGPLLALSPVPAVSSPSGTPSAPAPVQLASSGLGGGSGPDWVDPTGQNIAAIERRLDQQIRQNRSPPEIAQTRFALAQAIWDSSDAAGAQNRALTLARESKAALDAVTNDDSTVVELRQAVNDWITMREGPVGKPGGPHLTFEHAQLKLESMDSSR